MDNEEKEIEVAEGEELVLSKGGNDVPAVIDLKSLGSNYLRLLSRVSVSLLNPLGSINPVNILQETIQNPAKFQELTIEAHIKIQGMIHEIREAAPVEGEAVNFWKGVSDDGIAEMILKSMAEEDKKKFLERKERQKLVERKAREEKKGD